MFSGCNYCFFLVVHNTDYSWSNLHERKSNDFDYYPLEVAEERRKGDIEVATTGKELHWTTEEKDKNGNLLPDEVRLNKYGQFLRKTSLDELPEAFNILKGDMSIIGPRPLLVSYLPWYTEEEKQRHDVRPGLSGLAQVNGRNSVTWEEKFSWDLKYVDRITFLGDVKITLDTVKKAFIKVEGVELNHEGNLANIRKKAVEEASVSK